MLRTFVGIGTFLVLATTQPYASAFEQSATHQVPDPSFVHVFSDGVWFLQWTDRNGTLSGQSQSVVVQRDLILKSDSELVSGVQSGADITLRLGGLLGSIAYTGMLRGSTLVLNIPLQNGTIENVVFQRGTVEDYNRAVAALRARVDEAIRVRQRAADLAARQRAVALANERLGGALSAVQTATTRLNTATNFGPALDQFAKDWARMQQNDERLRADAAKEPLTCSQLQGRVAYDLQGTLAYDLQGRLGYDNTGLFEYRQQTIHDATSRLIVAIQELRQAFAALQQAVAQNILGTPGPAYTDMQVQAVAAAGEQQVHASNDAVRTAKAQRDHILAEAQTLFKDDKDFVGGLTCKR